MAFRHWIAGLSLLLLLGSAPAYAELSPAEVRAKIDAAGTAEDHDADAVVVVDYEDVFVRPSGIGTARMHRVVKVLRPAAIRQLAVQRFGFDPHTNRLDLVAVRVHRADGDVIDIPLDEHRIEQPEPAGSIFWGTRQYLVALPRLAVGDAVETISDMTGFNVAYLAQEANGGMTVGAGERNAVGEVLQPPVPGHWHDEVHFWTTRDPIIEKRYSVRMPISMPLQFEMYNGDIRPAVLMDGDHMVYTFQMNNLAPLKSEPHQEPWPNVAPKLLLATLPTWNDKAKWLYEVSEPQFGWDDAIEAKVNEIIAGLKTDEEKYTALNHWVADNIRYAGTSRGMCEGYTVHKSTETFHDRAGVCKDKAGMLVTMLRIAGFESYLVMTMARQRVDRVPADQFNHAVTCIRWDDGSLTLLDPTWMPTSRDNWSTLEPLQHVVYGLPEGKDLAKSPYFPPEDCTAHWTGQSRIDPGGGLHGKFDFWANGAPEGRIRRSLHSLHPSRRQLFFEDTLRRVSPNAQPTTVRTMNPLDYSGPLRIECDYEAPDYAVGTGQRRYLKLPLLQTPLGNRALYDLFGDTGADEREYGLKLLATRLGRFEETIKLPAGWEVAGLPEPVELDGPAAALKFEITADGNEIRYTCDLTVKRWLIPPDEYANFKEVIEAFENLTGPVVVCETEGARVQR